MYPLSVDEESGERDLLSDRSSSTGDVDCSDVLKPRTTSAYVRVFGAVMGVIATKGILSCNSSVISPNESGESGLLSQNKSSRKYPEYSKSENIDKGDVGLL